MIDCLLTEREPVAKWLDEQHPGVKFTDSEWKKMEVMRSMLRPCETVCKLLGGEKNVTASVVLPACAYPKKQMTVTEDDVGYERRFKEEFYADLISRLNNIDCNANLQVTTPLNPWFKHLKAVPKTQPEQVWSLISWLLTDALDGPADQMDAASPPSKKPRQQINKFSLDSDTDDDENGVSNFCEAKWCNWVDLWNRITYQPWIGFLGWSGWYNAGAEPLQIHPSRSWWSSWPSELVANSLSFISPSQQAC